MGRMDLPQEGRPPEQLLSDLEGLRAHDADWRAGRCFALVYSAGEAHERLLKQAHHLFFSENALNPMAFKSLHRMETEVVSMIAGLLHGAPSAVGTMSSGGTESLLLAVKTYRDLALSKRPWLRRPEVILPKSAHVALEKAAHLFGVRVRYAELDDGFRVRVDHVKKLINSNTIMIVGSAPQYPQGVIDPIEELAALALKREIPLHVDACVGGLVLPFLERLGCPIPRWDFRVPGVTSISADLHKYGYAAKGASVILYRNMDYLRHQFFVSTDWSGGVYASPSLPGTRPGGPIAAAWAGLQALGESGYLELSQKAFDAKKTIAAGVGDIPGLEILGKPEATLLSIGSSDPEIDMFAVADQLHERGWHFDRNQKPPSIHLTVMAGHQEIVPELLADLRSAVQYLRAHPEARRSGSAPMYGMMAKMPIRSLVKSGVVDMMAKMYGPEAQLPDVSDPNAGNDGFVARTMDKFGEPILATLEKIEAIKERLPRAFR